MKPCPLCAEDVKDEALKCRYCGSTLPSPALQLLKHLETNGVQVTLDNGKITLRGAVSLVNDEMRAQVKAVKPQLVTLLSVAPSVRTVGATTHQGHVETRYPALRSIAGAYRLLAYLAAAVAAVLAMVTLVYMSQPQGPGMALLPLFAASVVGGLITLISLLAASESILVLLDIEENTRRAAQQ